MMRPQPRSTLFPYTTLFRSNVAQRARRVDVAQAGRRRNDALAHAHRRDRRLDRSGGGERVPYLPLAARDPNAIGLDRKSTRLNSSHVEISYAVFCLKKKKK